MARHDVVGQDDLGDRNRQRRVFDLVVDVGSAGSIGDLLEAAHVPAVELARLVGPRSEHEDGRDGDPCPDRDPGHDVPSSFVPEVEPQV